MHARLCVKIMNEDKNNAIGGKIKFDRHFERWFG